MNIELMKIVEETVASFEGLSVYDVSYNEHSRMLRVFIDSPGGVDIALCAHVSERLSRRLDEIDIIPGSYRLEISSPGVERSLRKKEHFKNAIGKRVKIVLADRVVEGSLTAVNDKGITLNTEEGEKYTLYTAVKRAKVVMPTLVKGGKA